MPHEEQALDTIDSQLETLAVEEIIGSNEVRRIQQNRDHLLIQRAMIQRGKTVYSLPSEILLHIFCIFVQWDDDDWQGGEDIDWKPVILSHVCSSWRFLVLNASSLWVCLDFSRYPSVRPLISRSKQQRVDIVHALQPLPGYKYDHHFESTLRSTLDRKSTRLNSSHSGESRMPSSA